MYKLYARAGWGSCIVEAQLAFYGLPYQVEDVDDLFQSAAARERLAVVNPLSQIPTLVLPDQSILTESAAITLHLSETAGSTALAPAPRSAERALFLRWLIFIVTNVYPTFTYADDPARFVAAPEAQKAFRASVDAYAQRLWRIVEQQAGAPWFLGQQFSALDVYLAVMTEWRPKRPWFAENCPRLHAIALRTDELPAYAPVRARNFPNG